jgi:2'-5' RNA ligase
MAVWKSPLLVLRQRVFDIRDVSADEAKEILTYWLIPAEPARSHFRSLIQDLAQRFDAPVFEPHVTLYVTEPGNENPADVLRETFRNIEPPRLSIIAIKYSDEFTKTLFVEFQPDESLARLNGKLRAASASRHKYRLNPHLSLIYKAMSSETKVQLANSLRIPSDDVRFDSAKAVISPARIEARADVEAWRVVAEESFAG